MLGITMAEVADIAERRIFRLLTPELNGGLPAMLARNSGLDGGLMMVQYTAAALVSDNKTLAHPDSVDSIPSGANQEDHVSMGANAARHALESWRTYAIARHRFMTATQAIDLRQMGGPAGRGTAAACHCPPHRVIPRTRSETTPDIEALVELIRSAR
jgi:histidine ammonia-lyase